MTRREFLALAGPARHVTLDPTGRRLWTALGTKAREIAVVALEEGERPRTTPAS